MHFKAVLCQIPPSFIMHLCILVFNKTQCYFLSSLFEFPLWAVLLFLVYCPVSSSHFSSNNFQYHFPPLFNIFALCQTERYDTDKTTLVYFTSAEITVLYYLWSNAPQNSCVMTFVQFYSYLQHKSKSDTHYFITSQQYIFWTYIFIKILESN